LGVAGAVEGVWMAVTTTSKDFVLTVKGKAKVLYSPTAKQVVFHEHGARNVLYGGAAGGGKSHALRWDAYMRCLSVPHYRALLLRRTYPELENTHLENVPVDQANGLPCEYLKSERKVRFGNGAVLQFGHCEDESAVAKYLSTEYDAIYFDELVTFSEKQFLMIRSRARSTKPGVRPVIKAGTNPGGPESHWVRRRFIWQDITAKEDPRYRPEDYAYVPATLDDNPHIDQEEYAANLESLPEELAQAYRWGNWDIFPGQYFGEWRKTREIDGKEVGWHVSKDHIVYPPEFRRVLAMDWGYVKPGWVGWYVLLPEGHAYLEDEYVPVRVVAFDQGVEVARRCRERGLKRLSYLVYDHQMETPQGDTGETLIESFRRGLRKGGVALSTIKADKDRKNGWGRVRGWFKADPTGQRPWMQVSPECRYTVRTIPALISDKNDPEDVDSDGEDHAADGKRYFAMSRPAVGAAADPRKVPPPWSLKWLSQQAERPLGILSR
jgi:hypothetical protein